MLKKFIQLSIILNLALIAKSYSRTTQVECLDSDDDINVQTLIIVDSDGVSCKISLNNENYNEDSEYENSSEVFTNRYDYGASIGSWNVFSRSEK